MRAGDEIPSKPLLLESSQLPAPCPQGGLRTAALQFSAAPDVAVALVVGARSHQQISEDYNSLQAKIPSKFWTELKQQGLIESDASLPVRPAR
jgi:hypothetical protein